MKADDSDLRVGQIIKTMGRQIVVPDWHEKYVVDTTFLGNISSGAPMKMQRVTDMPIIRLSCGYSHGMASSVQIKENWAINTNKWRQSGLVCFVPERYLGMAILSASIIAVREKSVIAQPIEWIEVNPLLGVNHIGDDARETFNKYLEKVDEKIDGNKDFNEQDLSSLDYRAIWHNKEMDDGGCMLLSEEE